VNPSQQIGKRWLCLGNISKIFVKGLRKEADMFNLSHRIKMRSRCVLSAVVAILVLSPRNAAAQSWTWTMEDKAIDTDGSNTSMVADDQGNLHLSYYFPTGGQLKYAFKSVGTDHWDMMSLEHGLNVFVTRIALDSKDNPHICYTPQKVKYAFFDGSKWHTQSVDSAAGLVGYYCSIQITPDGKPEMSWYMEGGTYFRYAILQDGAWQVRSIEGGGGAYPGKWNSMVLDTEGNPHMAYSWFPTGQLKYTAFDGKKWSVSILDSPDQSPGGERGMGVSLALRSSGDPIISYYDTQSLRVAQLSNGVWKKDIVASLPPFGAYSWRNFRSTLVLDSKGNPHISFESLAGLEHAWWDGKRWHRQLILAPRGTTFFESSMAIDKEDNLFICFKDPSDGALRLATGRFQAAQQSANVEHEKTAN